MQSPIQILGLKLQQLLHQKKLFDPADSHRLSEEARAAIRECGATLDEMEINLLARKILGPLDET